VDDVPGSELTDEDAASEPVPPEVIGSELTDDAAASELVPPEVTHPTDPAPAAPAIANKHKHVLFAVALLALAVAEGVGSFGSWIFYAAPNSQNFEYKGITSWRGYGWMALILAVATVVAIVLDLVQPSRTVKAVVATLFGSLSVIGGFFVIQFVAFPLPGNYTADLAWGSSLCLGAGVIGLCTSIFWFMGHPAKVHLHLPQPYL